MRILYGSTATTARWHCRQWTKATLLFMSWQRLLSHFLPFALLEHWCQCSHFVRKQASVSATLVTWRRWLTGWVWLTSVRYKFSLSTTQLSLTLGQTLIHIAASLSLPFIHSMPTLQHYLRWRTRNRVRSSRNYAKSLTHYHRLTMSAWTMRRMNTSVCSLNRKVLRYSKALLSRPSLLKQRVGSCLTHNILIWEISSEQPTSLTGQTISNGMRLTARHCLILRTRLTRRWLSSTMYSLC